MAHAFDKIYFSYVPEPRLLDAYPDTQDNLNKYDGVNYRD